MVGNNITKVLPLSNGNAIKTIFSKIKMYAVTGNTGSIHMLPLLMETGGEGREGKEKGKEESEGIEEGKGEREGGKLIRREDGKSRR